MPSCGNHPVLLRNINLSKEQSRFGTKALRTIVYRREAVNALFLGLSATMANGIQNGTKKPNQGITGVVGCDFNVWMEKNSLEMVGLPA